MPYRTARDIKEDALFRISEPVNHATWGEAAMRYLNRVHRAVTTGTSEFLPEVVQDWWWLRRSALLTLEPIFNTGSVTVAQGVTEFTFSDAPNRNLTGWRLKVDGHPDVFKVVGHAASTVNAEFDMEYTGLSGSFTFTAMKLEYSLSESVESILSPIIAFRGKRTIIGMTPERMDIVFPISQVRPGDPMAFSLEDEQTVRFSHGGNREGLQQRLEYRYRPIVTDLEDSDTSIPLLPQQFRHILSDMVTAHLLLDRDDDRADGFIMAAKTGLAAMTRDNTRRSAKIDNTLGRIYPRQRDFLAPGPLRTDAGLIIG